MPPSRRRRAAVDNVGDGNRRVSQKRPVGRRRFAGRQGRKRRQDKSPIQETEESDQGTQEKECEYEDTEATADEEETTVTATTSGTDFSGLSDLPDDQAQCNSPPRHNKGSYAVRSTKARPVRTLFPSESTQQTSNGDELQVSLQKLRSLKGTICTMFAEKLKSAGITPSKKATCLGEMRNQLRKQLKRVRKRTAGQEDDVVQNVMSELRQGEMVLIRMAELERSATFFDEVIRGSIWKNQDTLRSFKEVTKKRFPWFKLRKGRN